MRFRRWLQGVDRGLVKWVGPAGFGLGLLLAVAIGLPTGVDIYQNWQNIDPSERSQAGITLLQALFTIVGGVAIFWNIVLSRRQLAATDLTAVSFSPKTIRFQADYDNARSVAWDLPSLLSTGGKDVVMLIAQDPYNNMTADSIWIGTPYALHIKKCRENLHTRQYLRLIDFLLEAGYQVYLTDI